MVGKAGLPSSGLGQTLPIAASAGHVRSTSDSCRNRCNAANGRSVPGADIRFGAKPSRADRRSYAEADMTKLQTPPPRGFAPCPLNEPKRQKWLHRVSGPGRASVRPRRVMAYCIVRICRQRGDPTLIQEERSPTGCPVPSIDQVALLMTTSSDASVKEVHDAGAAREIGSQ